MMAQQPSGWGSTQNAANLPVVDAFARNLLMKYGGRTDDVWAFHDMPGYKREIGGARGVIGGDGGSFSTGSGSVRISGMGRGGTPSDPGGYNYETLANTAGTTAQLLGTAANFAMDRMSGSDPDTSFRFGNTPIYQKYRGKQQDLARRERIQNRQTARQQQQQAAAKQQQMANFASQTFSTSMGLAAGVQAGNKPPKAGASSPMPRGGTPPPGPVNLLTGPTALGQPPKKPRAARSTVPKPKATRPVPAATLNDPSNW